MNSISLKLSGFVAHMLLEELSCMRCMILRRRWGDHKLDYVVKNMKIPKFK